MTENELEEALSATAAVPMVKPEELGMYKLAMINCAQGFLAAHANPATNGLPMPGELADMCSAYAGALVLEYRRTEQAVVQNHNAGQGDRRN